MTRKDNIFTKERPGLEAVDQAKDSTTLSDLDISKLNFEMISEEKEQLTEAAWLRKTRQQAVEAINHNGKQMELVADRMDLSDTYDNDTQIGFRAVINEGGKEVVTARLTIQMIQDTSSSNAITGIEKNPNLEKGKHEGIGAVLYEKMVEYIQSIASEKDITIKHVVAMVPKNDLSQDRWHEIFDPILTSHGYEQTSPTAWEKMYIP